MKKHRLFVTLFTAVILQSAQAVSALPNSGHPLIFENATHGKEQVIFTLTDLGDLTQPNAPKIQSEHFASQPTAILPAPSLLTAPFWHHNMLVTARITETHDNNPMIQAIPCGGPDNGKFSYVQGFRFVAKLVLDPATRTYTFICETAPRLPI